MQIKIPCFVLLLFGNIIISYAQHPSVTWYVNANRSVNAEYIIDFTASMRTGWHIYSQHLGDGGPIPTVITLDPSDDFIALGKAIEFGDPVKFYDSLYEMEIIWYMKQVCFRQRVKILGPVTSLRGSIDYMACNEHICIPQREEFTVALPVRDTKD